MKTKAKKQNRADNLIPLKGIAFIRVGAYVKVFGLRVEAIPLPSFFLN
jgi:hypothetical protein